MLLINKTDFIRYTECKKNAWLKIHRPELKMRCPDILHPKPLSEFKKGLMKTGNEVDELAREYFPFGALCGSEKHTRTAIRGGADVLYQPKFKTDRYTAVCDILIQNKDGAYDLYEVKSSTIKGVERSEKKKRQYKNDIGFQEQVLKACGIPLGTTNLLLIDSDYEFESTLNVQQLFKPMPVETLPPEQEHDMEEAWRFLTQKHEPEGVCDCFYKPRSEHCDTAWHSNPKVPKYSVHDIVRISEKKLRMLAAQDIVSIQDVPSEFELTDIQLKQVECAQRKNEQVNENAIKEFLADISFPISFLDYETYPLAVPCFEGYHPYTQIPFQFSLHILHQNGTLTHREFLHQLSTAPDKAFLSSLFEALPNSGSILVWSKQFEIGRNRELAKRNPEYEDRLNAVEKRVVDLIDPFKHMDWTHPDFKGKTSIKYVLPALVPEMSYTDLAIQDGAAAAQSWKTIIFDDLSPVEKKAEINNLLEYCKRDTQAMVDIYKAMRKQTESPVETV